MSIEDSGKLTKKELAKRLGVSRSSLYYRCKRPETDEALRVRIEAVMLNHPSYGHRRIANELGVNRKRIRRVMKIFRLKPARRARAPRKPCDVGREPRACPDVLAKLSPICPNFIWIGDFTYIEFHGRFVYLATVLDRFTAEVHGVALKETHCAELVVEAFQDALSKQEHVPKYFHSDQGSEYGSEQFVSLLSVLGVSPSLSPKSSPWRNGAQESFFGRFKVEFGDPNRFRTLPELLEAIYAHIAYYNQSRIHTRLRTSPRQFHQRWCQQQKQLSEIIESRQKLPQTHCHLATPPDFPTACCGEMGGASLLADYGKVPPPILNSS